MRTTQQLSITLTKEQAQMVKAKVESGEYASESEVIREGLRYLQERDRAFEKWLREEVVPAYEEWKADPSTAIPLDQVVAELRAHHGRRMKAGQK